jgi:hypothetical protein
MRKSLLLAILFILVFVSSVLADKFSGTDISGTWAVSTIGAMGDEYYDLFINAFDGDLVVTATHPQLGPMSGTGTLKVNAIKFKLKASGPNLPIQIEFTGTVTGGKMAGTKLVSGIPDNEKTAAQKGGSVSGAGGARGGASGGNAGGGSSEMVEMPNPGPWTAGLKYVSTRNSPAVP